MRLLICAGGTGGGVYPALAVLQALEDRLDAVLWVGGEGGMEANLIQRQEIAYAEIPAAGVHGVGLRALPGNVFKLVRGVFAARKIIRQFKPNALLFTGGYVAAPMAIAGLNIPTLLFVPDIEPGLALKFLSRFADRIAVSAPASKNYFNQQNKLVVSGYPARSALQKWDTYEARTVFKLTEDLPVILVFGGSKGARSINRAVIKILPELLKRTQLIHVSGKLDWEEVQQAQTGLSAELANRYHAYPYLHEEMGAAYTAANLVISRAGASSLGEFPLFELPAILVPYPYAWRYQKVNASYLVDQGAALMIKDEEMREELLSTILGLLDEPARLNEMRAAMAKLARPEAAKRIADLVLAMGDQDLPRKGDQI